MLKRGKMEIALRVLLILLTTNISAQNENSQWYFGYSAGLNFLNNPPSVLLNAAMNMPNSCASIADAAGNLLFYTNGQTIRNQSHAIMANGAGLHANGGGVSIMAVKQPGSTNLYYIFTIGDPVSFFVLKYSIVDMSLAAGQGSVVAKNVVVGSQNCTQKMTGTYHCNGKDIWIIVHDLGNNIFRSYLLTSTGLNTVSIPSSIGSIHAVSNDGPMKVSSSGNKLGVTVGGIQNTFRAVELMDFNNSTGVISNPITVFSESIGTGTSFYGIEFSPDNSKLYVAGNSGNYIHQWDLCAGSASAIAASHFSLSLPIHINQGLQLAQNGKIYVCTNGGGPALSTSLHVIHAPNNAGVACNLVAWGQSLGGQQSGYTLPNFFHRYKSNILNSSFTFSLSPTSGCHAVSFTAALPAVSCAAANYSVSAITWNFGDPASASNNSSSLNNPTHNYPSSGNYTVTQILHYPCGSDTLRQVISIPPPNLSTTSAAGCGEGSGSATVTAIGGNGPYSYTWMPSMQNNSVAINLSSGVHTVSVYDQGLQCTVRTTLSLTNIPQTLISIQPSSLITLCAGSQSFISITETANAYSWTPNFGLASSGNGSFVVTGIMSQNYTIAAISSTCGGRALLSVNVLPAPSPSIIAQKTLSCANSSVTLRAMGANQYLWHLPDNSVLIGSLINANVFPSPSNINTYTLTATGANTCKNYAVQTVSVIPAPNGILSGFTGSVCAPFCGAFNFIPSFPATSVNSNWSIEGQSTSGAAAFCLSQLGTYVLSGNLLDNQTLCTAKIFTSVTVFQKPEADFTYTPLKILAETDEAIFTGKISYLDPLEYTWHIYDGNGAYKKEGITTQHVFNEVGNYPVSLVVKNKTGCLDTVTKALNVRPARLLFVPNSFTPNSDNLNDVFKPVTRGIGISHYMIQVFNRWGVKVFESIDLNDGWDGTLKGAPCKSDVYTWYIKVTTDGEEDVLTGHVYLAR